MDGSKLEAGRQGQSESPTDFRSWNCKDIYQEQLADRLNITTYKTPPDSRPHGGIKSEQKKTLKTLQLSMSACRDLIDFWHNGWLVSLSEP
jgi:hypothetical protein